jgi:PAS domain S-box-containing protein
LEAPSRGPGRTGPPGIDTGPRRDGYEPVFWTAFRRSGNPMMIVDFDRRIVAVNEAGAAVAGRSVESLVGRRFTTLLEDPGDALDDNAWRALVFSGESLGHRRIRRPDGSTTVVDFAMRAATIDERVLVLGVAIHAHVERDDNDRHAPAPLTAREREIVHLIALGHVSREICDMLHVAPDTVRTHVRNAMAKTGAKTRAQLIAIALGDGLLEP